MNVWRIWRRSLGGAWLFPVCGRIAAATLNPLTPQPLLWPSSPSFWPARLNEKPNDSMTSIQAADAAQYAAKYQVRNAVVEHGLVRAGMRG
jgi:hypothetical protein